MARALAKRIDANITRRNRVWDEAEHPRDDRGRFARKGEGGRRWLSKIAATFEARGERIPEHVLSLASASEADRHRVGRVVPVDTTRPVAERRSAAVARLAGEITPKRGDVIDTPRVNGQTEVMPTTSAEDPARTAAGRVTTVTLPDGTTAKRVSKKNTYTHAVIETTDNRKKAVELRKLAVRFENAMAAVGAWQARGGNTSELVLKPYANGASGFESHLPGTEGLFPGMTDYRVRESWGKYGPDYARAEWAKRAVSLRENAAELDAGPAETHEAVRWSSRADLASGAIPTLRARAAYQNDSDVTRYSVAAVSTPGAPATSAAPAVPKPAPKPARFHDLDPRYGKLDIIAANTPKSPPVARPGVAARLAGDLTPKRESIDTPRVTRQTGGMPAATTTPGPVSIYPIPDLVPPTAQERADAEAHQRFIDERVTPMRAEIDALTAERDRLQLDAGLAEVYVKNLEAFNQTGPELDQRRIELTAARAELDKANAALDAKHAEFHSMVMEPDEPTPAPAEPKLIKKQLAGLREIATSRNGESSLPTLRREHIQALLDAGYIEESRNQKNHFTSTQYFQLTEAGRARLRAEDPEGYAKRDAAQARKAEREAAESEKRRAIAERDRIRTEKNLAVAEAEGLDLGVTRLFGLTAARKRKKEDDAKAAASAEAERVFSLTEGVPEYRPGLSPTGATGNLSAGRKFGSTGTGSLNSRLRKDKLDPPTAEEIEALRPAWGRYDSAMGRLDQANADYQLAARRRNYLADIAKIENGGEYKAGLAKAETDLTAARSAQKSALANAQGAAQALRSGVVDLYAARGKRKTVRGVGVAEPVALTSIPGAGGLEDRVGRAMPAGSDGDPRAEALRKAHLAQFRASDERAASESRLSLAEGALSHEERYGKPTFGDADLAREHRERIGKLGAAVAAAKADRDRAKARVSGAIERSIREAEQYRNRVAADREAAAARAGEAKEAERVKAIVENSPLTGAELDRLRASVERFPDERATAPRRRPGFGESGIPMPGAAGYNDTARSMGRKWVRAIESGDEAAISNASMHLSGFLAANHPGENQLRGAVAASNEVIARRQNVKTSTRILRRGTFPDITSGEVEALGLYERPGMLDSPEAARARLTEYRRSGRVLPTEKIDTDDGAVPNPEYAAARAPAKPPATPAPAATPPRIRPEAIKKVADLGTSFTGNPYFKLGPIEDLTSGEFLRLNAEQKDNVRFLLSKLAKRDDGAGAKARELQGRFGTWKPGAARPSSTERDQKATEARARMLTLARANVTGDEDREHIRKEAGTAARDRFAARFADYGLGSDVDILLDDVERQTAEVKGAEINRADVERATSALQKAADETLDPVEEAEALEGIRKMRKLDVGNPEAARQGLADAEHDLELIAQLNTLTSAERESGKASRAAEAARIAGEAARQEVSDMFGGQMRDSGGREVLSYEDRQQVEQYVREREVEARRKSNVGELRARAAELEAASASLRTDGVRNAVTTRARFDKNSADFMEDGQLIAHNKAEGAILPIRAIAEGVRGRRARAEAAEKASAEFHAASPKGMDEAQGKEVTAKIRAMVGPGGEFELTSEDDKKKLIRDDVRRVKKAHGIPSRAAIAKMDRPVQRIAESAERLTRLAEEARLNAENNRLQIEAARRFMAENDLRPNVVSDLEKAIRRIEIGGAGPDSVVRAERERDIALASWGSVRDGNLGPKDDVDASVTAGLKDDEREAVREIAIFVGGDAARRLADRLRPVATPNQGRKPANLDGVNLEGLDDGQLSDLFHDLSTRDDTPPEAFDRLAAEMDRRDQKNTPSGSGLYEGVDPGNLTPEQERVDRLLDRGYDYAEAYAEVYGGDPEAMRREASSSATVDRRVGETLDQAARRSYDELTYVRYLQAEQDVRGHMLSREGKAAGIDPVSLFSGNSARARKYASEDLQRWWAEHGRMTFTEFKAQTLARGADVRSSESIRLQGNSRDFI